MRKMTIETKRVEYGRRQRYLVSCFRRFSTILDERLSFFLPMALKAISSIDESRLMSAVNDSCYFESGKGRVKVKKRGSPFFVLAKIA